MICLKLALPLTLRSFHLKVAAVPDHMFEKALRILTKPKIVENSSGYHLSRGLDDNPLTSPEYSDFSTMCKYSGIFHFLKKPLEQDLEGDVSATDG